MAFAAPPGFRSRRATRAPRAALWLACALAAGCSRGPRSPEAALEKLKVAVAAADAEALFEALDQPTRWGWMSVQRCHREAYDVVLSNFPPGADREAKLRHFEPGAMAQTAAELFARVAGAAALASLKGRIAEGAQPVAGKDGEATVKANNAPPLLFRFADKRWGYSGFADEAALLVQRATADLEMVKTSATDYERAAARGKL